MGKEIKKKNRPTWESNALCRCMSNLGTSIQCVCVREGERENMGAGSEGNLKLCCQFF